MYNDCFEKHYETIRTATSTPLFDRSAIFRDGVGQWITIFAFSSLYQNWCDIIYNLKFIIIDINKYVENVRF